MDKITKVNVEGGEYGFVAGQTVKGVSGALASDYVKHVILPEGAEVVEGMLVAVTFVNENTAGYSGEKTVYSTDGINFYWDSGYTQLITLPPQGCYTVTATETQYEYKLSEYPVLVMGDMTKPFCDSRGHPAGGKLWGAGDTVTVINLENRFIALQTTVNEIIQGSSLPVSSGAVYEKCNSLEPVDHVTSGNMHSVTSNAVAESFGQWVTIYDEGPGRSFIKGCKMQWGTLLRFRFSGFFGNFRTTQYIPNGYNLYTIPEGWRPVTHDPNRLLIAVDTTSVRLPCIIDIHHNGNMNMYFEGNTPIGGGIDNVTGVYADILFLLQ